MPLFRTYHCPSCAGMFEEFHMKRDEPAPRFCKLCGFDTAGEAFAQALTAPRIASPIAKAMDDSYRAAEDSSLQRVEMAKSMGLDTEAANALKVTDFRTSGLRTGEVAAIPVRNDVTKAMELAPSQMGFNPADYAAASTAVSTGSYANAGLRAMQYVRQQHGAGRNPVTTAPAIETQMKDYRQRV